MKKYLIILFLGVAAFWSCNEEYLIDGGVANPNVNLSTYEYLKTNPIFDTLVILIDKAGLKDKVNGANTFMAPTDYSIKNFVNAVLSDMRVLDPLAKYTINDIPVDTLKKLEAYLIPGALTRDKLTKEGKEYTSLNGEKRKISLEPRDIYTGYLSDKPEFVYFYKKKGTKWDDYAATGLDKAEQDLNVQVRTSGIISQTGVVHVLQGNHVAFFYEAKY